VRLLEVRGLRRPFVVTVAVVGGMACGREAVVAGVDADANANANVDAKADAKADADASAKVDASTSTSTSTSTSEERVRLEDYPRVRNSVDGSGRRIFRAYKGDTCYVELPWPKGKPRLPGEDLPQQKAACPAEMKTKAWETCRGGTILAKNEGSDCICFEWGNPPPLPVKITCP
jgi:hypothetical protein